MDCTKECDGTDDVSAGMKNMKMDENQEIEDFDESAGNRATKEWLVDEDTLQNNDKDLKPEELESRKIAAEKQKSDGNTLFQASNYREAAKMYTLALNTCPFVFKQERSILYANRAACFLYMDETKTGIEDCTKSLEMNNNYLKAILRRALLYEKDEKFDEALEDYKKVLEMDPQNAKAIEACMRLPSMINERNEKLKTEMLSKLKDLGNLVLRPFGLSTDSFNVQKDPTTGSYSVNFQQNK